MHHRATGSGLARGSQAGEEFRAGLKYLWELPQLDDRSLLLSTKEAVAKVNHDVGAYSALAVVSAVFATSNVSTLRSVREKTFTESGWGYEALMAVSLFASTMLSMYATVISSLLRYYGYVAMAKQQSHLWLRLCSTPCMVIARKSCFWAFVGSFFLALVELQILSVVKFNRFWAVQVCLVVVGTSANLYFVAVTIYILGVSRWLFDAPPPEGYGPVPVRDESSDGIALPRVALNGSVCCDVDTGDATACHPLFHKA